MKEKVLFDRLLVKVEKSPDEIKTAGGIIIPVNNTRPNNHRVGEVVEKGNGRYENGILIPMTVKIGDNIMFDCNAAPLVKILGEEYYIVREMDVFLVL